MTTLSTWTLETGDGNELGAGYQAHSDRAAQWAQAEADRLGITTYLREDGSDGEPEAFEPEAPSDRCANCGTVHNDETGEGRYSDGAICDENGVRREAVMVTRYYAVTDANGPISVRLGDFEREEEAREAFLALDTRAAIDGSSTDAEDDLGIAGEHMDDGEFAAALTREGANHIGPLDATYGGPDGNLVHAGWDLWEVRTNG